MKRIEKTRKIIKNVQLFGTIIIIAISFLAIFIFGDKIKSTNSFTFILVAIMVLFVFLTFVGAPLQSKLQKIIIEESLNGLVEDLKFNRKKSFTKDSFDKLMLAPKDFSLYSCTDYYSFMYKGKFIESSTVRAYDEFKVLKPKKKNSKKMKTVKEITEYFHGRVYIIPYESENRYNIYGKKEKDVTRKKDLLETKYNNEIQLKIKKLDENFEIYYKDEKPIINMQSLVDKLYVLKTQAKGPVSLFVRKDKMVLCINNSHYYREIEIKNPLDEQIVRDYRKHVSMVLSFLNSLDKM